MSHEIQQPVRSKDSLCLDCGLDVGECKDDKRGLGSATAKKVVEIWRCLMERPMSCLMERPMSCLVERTMSCGLEERVCCESLSQMEVEQEKLCRNFFLVLSITQRFYRHIGTVEKISHI